jgi:hypothetical protein
MLCSVRTTQITKGRLAAAPHATTLNPSADAALGGMVHAERWPPCLKLRGRLTEAASAGVLGTSFQGRPK